MAAPPQPQPLDYNQILGQSASGIGKVSSAASKANTSYNYATAFSPYIL